MITQRDIKTQLMPAVRDAVREEAPYELPVSFWLRPRTLLVVALVTLAAIGGMALLVWR